jgi:hypothetical protein
MLQMLAHIARLSVTPLAILLALSVLAQAVVTGAAAAIDGSYWACHKYWIAIFQASAFYLRRGLGPAGTSG